MNNLNSIIIEGNLVRDPLLKTTPNGHQVCSFSVASNRFYRQNEQLEKEVSFFDVETWSKLAQTCGEVLKKGRGVRIVGRLKQDRWEDATGKSLSKVKIVIFTLYTTLSILRRDGDNSCLVHTLGSVLKLKEIMIQYPTKRIVQKPSLKDWEALSPFIMTFSQGARLPERNGFALKKILHLKNCILFGQMKMTD